MRSLKGFYTLVNKKFQEEVNFNFRYFYMELLISGGFTVIQFM